MTITINTEMVAMAAEEIRQDVEAATRRGNLVLSDCQEACQANVGLQTSTALRSCLDAWAATLGSLFDTTVGIAADLSATAQCVDYTDDENARAAAALEGLL